MDMLDHPLGVSPERCKRRHGLSCVLLLFRVELRRRKFVCAGLQAVHRLAGHIPALPVVEHCYGLLAALQPLEKKDCLEQAAALRGKELRIYQRTAYRVYGVRQYGTKENNAHYGHGTVAGGYVPPKSTFHIAAERHEIPVFSVD